MDQAKIMALTKKAQPTVLNKTLVFCQKLEPKVLIPVKKRTE